MHRVLARNLSAQSENRIHDDATARRFGFTGALVPGVEVHAYACHPAVARWGADWLARGSIATRFFQPVYAGEEVSVAAAEAEGTLALTVTAGGREAARGEAAMPPAEPAPDPAAWAWRAPPETRPPAGEASLAPGTVLGTRAMAMTAAVQAEYLEAVGEGSWACPGLVHPGLLLRQCNQALVQNVVLGPWIHVGSRVRHLAAVPVGAAVTVRARVSANDTRKGHRFVDLDCLVLADGAPAALVFHTAIWRPRQVAEA
jgi:acyl dehydratase